MRLLWFLVLISAVSAAERDQISSFSNYCVDDCKLGEKNTYSCITQLSRSDWCSPSPSQDYRGIQCKTGDCCGTHGKWDYNWCWTTDGKWGYCSPSTQYYEGMKQADRFGHKCINPCDIYPTQSTEKFYCLTEGGEGWSQCSPLPDTTVRGLACRVHSKCGTGGKFRGKTWCYTDDNDSWDYCGRVEGVTEDSKDFDQWQYNDGTMATLQAVLFGSAITAVPDPLCRNNFTEDVAVATTFEFTRGSRPQTISNEGERRTAYGCIKEFHTKYGSGNTDLPTGTDQNPIAIFGHVNSSIRMDIKNTHEEGGEYYYTINLHLNSTGTSTQQSQQHYQQQQAGRQAGGGGLTTIASCTIAQRVAQLSPRYVSIALYNSIRFTRNIKVQERKVRRRYSLPKRG